MKEKHPTIKMPRSSHHSIRLKILGRIWDIVNVSIFRWNFWFMRPWRVFLLRCFGAQIAWDAAIARTAKIDFPWNLKMGNASTIDNDCWLQCLEPIIIDENAIIGARSSLITGSHNLDSTDFAYTGKQIHIQHHAWVASCSIVRGGVTIHEGGVASLGSVVVKDIPAWSVYGGNPAKFLKKRKITNA